MQTIELAKIRTDGGTQMRTAINNETMLDYRDKWKSGVVFHPIDVFFDGVTYWLADGFHRFYGAREARKKEIPATVHSGSQRDAILFSCGANGSHGLRRTNADKRLAVTALLSDSEWSHWSDRVIAEKCGVSQPFVSDIRTQLITVISCEDGEPAREPSRTKGRDGKSRKRPSRRKKKPTNRPVGDCGDKEIREPTPSPQQETCEHFTAFKVLWDDCTVIERCLIRDYIEANWE